LYYGLSCALQFWIVDDYFTVFVMMIYMYYCLVDEDEDNERITVRSDEEMAAMFQAVRQTSSYLSLHM
jgi:hypothetical protein